MGKEHQGWRIDQSTVASVDRWSLNSCLLSINEAVYRLVYSGLSRQVPLNNGVIELLGEGGGGTRQWSL